MTPLVTIQLLGLIGKFKAVKKNKAVEPFAPEIMLSDEVVDFDIYDEQEDK